MKLALLLLILSSNVGHALCPFILDRDLEQGGMAYGAIPIGFDLLLGGKKIPISRDRKFIIGIHRDHDGDAEFTVIDKTRKRKFICK